MEQLQKTPEGTYKYNDSLDWDLDCCIKCCPFAADRSDWSNDCEQCHNNKEYGPAVRIHVVESEFGEILAELCTCCGDARIEGFEEVIDDIQKNKINLI